MVTVVVGMLVAVLLVGSALAQDTSATIRTHQGVSYRVADPSLEVFFTIGEPKEKKEEAKFQPAISITTSAAASAAAGEQPAGAGQEDRLLRGQSQASDITLWRQGVETRIAWDQIRVIRFARMPVRTATLPPYIPYHRYSASVTLVSGQQLEADYVNLGGTIVRGTAPNGRLDIPWEEVESIIFER
jgi:hypothetical protein